MKDLSILIPARNEQFLARTVKDILEHIEADTDIIVVLDGAWPDDPIPQHERVKILFNPVSIGQRAATNQAARLSDAKYLMKVDAHCAFDKGFDRKMIEKMEEDITMVPVMRNLHAFNWVCDKCHLTEYQGPTHPCPQCGSVMRKDIVWIPKTNPQSYAYRFDSTMHFQYWGEWGKKQHGDLTETLSIQGSCFMLTNKKYWELDICSEDFHSWGQQGVEVACKTWLSGGRVLVNRTTWYAHLFRTKGDFSFPYPQSQKEIDENRKLSRELFANNTWKGAKHSFQWLLDRFAPVPDWHDKSTIKKPSKGVVYYTDNQLSDPIFTAVQRQILKGIKEKHIISVSLQPIQFGTNIVLPLERGYLTMAKQILAGLEASTAEVIFFCEHDVLYHPSHFDFIPPDKTKIYYNTNVWIVRQSDGYSYRVDDCRQLSGLVAYRDVLIKHYKERIKRMEQEGFSRKMGFEPGTHNRKERVDDLKSEKYESRLPNLDIKHGKNLTGARWSPDQFRNKKYTVGWKVDNEVEGWGELTSVVKSLNTST